MTRQMISAVCLLAMATWGVPVAARANGAKDNVVDNVRPIPPPGVAVPAADRADLEAGITELGQAIDALHTQLRSQPALLDLLPDVIIYHNAVRYALTYNEFFDPREIGVARTLLKQGLERAAELREGRAPWNSAVGLVVRGYISRIDGSVQPYGLVVPASYRPGTPYQHRLDLWFHGRGETLSEVNFLNEHQRSAGEFTPPDTFVLHPYGRYCNANKFAGDIDTIEALAHARKHYPIDENRISVRGFSMGGAACWQFAVHYAGDWAAAAPGAGFAETADFLKVFQNETVKPTWYEQKLWHLYDSTDYAVNLFNCPTVSYSGEKDSQRQAADEMDKALKKEGITLLQVIGANAGHFYTADAKVEISRRMDSIMAHGRDPVPAEIRFTTWTLRYNCMKWLSLDGLEHHWERARVNARIVDTRTVKLDTRNVTALTLSMPSGFCPLDTTYPPTVVLDRQRVTAPPALSDRSWTAHFRRTGSRWAVVTGSDDAVLRKRPGLQGPIDDAFMDSFLMVAPTGKPLNAHAAAWCDTERKHAIVHWRQQFRGEAPVKDDADVTAADIATHNLVLWGDPASNSVLARIADRLPIRWDAAGVHLGAHTYAPDRYVPVLIYPNPLNPKRYVVINSGFTYREYDYLNNARQVPKLPDYAVFDINTAPTSRAPGAVADAGFFDESWQLLPDGGRK